MSYSACISDATADYLPSKFKLMVCTVARGTEEEQKVESRECFKVIVWHFRKCTRIEERINITFASVCEISG